MSTDSTDRVIANTAQLVSPHEADALREAGAVFIDVRRRNGTVEVEEVPGAVVVNKETAGTVLDPSSPELPTELVGALGADIVVFCNSEFGSDPVVAHLNRLGYKRVSHIEGGFKAWSASKQ